MTVFAFFNLTHLTAILLTAAPFLLSTSDGANAKDLTVEVPAALNPDKLSIFRLVSATGVQIYACAHNPAGAAGWVFKRPDAQLFDPQGKLVGKHYAGPTWEDRDGSKVVGAVKKSLLAPVDENIPWLLLGIKSIEGWGAFTQAHAIVRMETTGGIAPGEGCDEEHAGHEASVSYTAIYVFLK